MANYRAAQVPKSHSGWMVLAQSALPVLLATVVGRGLSRTASAHPAPWAGTVEALLVTSVLALLGAWIGWRRSVSGPAVGAVLGTWILLFAAIPVLPGLFPEGSRTGPATVLSYATELLGPVIGAFALCAWSRGRVGG
jgi:hypothetical protein